jgi:alpha-galactosidase/6-phospho-beta-glucosidase family protein
MTTWLTNKARYRKEYFENGDKLNTPYLAFGKDIAELVESGNYKELLPDLVVYDKPEFEIRCEIAGVPVLSFLDSYDSENNVFIELKTGKIPWTQSRVQKHEQLPFYATALKWRIGKIPEYCDLTWIETKDVGKKITWEDEETGLHNEERKTIEVTGRLKSFHRTFDEREILRMEQLIIRTAEEISEAYIKFLKEI